MPLSPGERIGPYEITGTIGAGGMGDVYRARDTRLDRTVAIKVVRADFGERFEREAKAISALNHPHICTLHDVGHADGTAYLVMEYVPGAPIAGPMKVHDVIKFGLQICDALHAAHRQNIVHRDLKPANILMTKGGIKLLDFGLAKPQKPGPDAASEEATVAALTGAHTIVGTPQYMAPEQIEGRDTDVRSDIFALGCVLYEMVTGQRAFDGKSASSVMAAILATEPRKPSELVPVTPPSLEWIILRCLEKDPDARWESAHDVGMQLRWVAEHPATPGSAPAPPARGSFLPGLAAGILLTAVAAGLWTWFGPARGGNAPAGAAGQIASAIHLPDGLDVRGLNFGTTLSLPPDGRQFAFAGGAETRSAIYLQPLDRFDPVKVEGTDGGTAPFFSPSGDWIGFWADGRLKKVPLGGGAAVDLAPVSPLRGSVWLDDDTIVYSSVVGGLMRVSARGGGTPTALTTLDAAKNEKTHRGVTALPGGKSVVFFIGSDELETYDEARIVALNLETGRITELVKGYAPVYSWTGHLLFVRNGSVFAVPFDPATLEIGGSPVQVLKDVATLASFGMGSLSLAPGGTLAFVPGGERQALSRVRWIDREGRTEPIDLEARSYNQVQMSPDQRRLAFMMLGANNALWTYDLERKQTTRVTFRREVTGFAWAADSSHLIYWTGIDLRSVTADGSGQDEVLVPAAAAGGRQLFPAAWSADGRVLALTASADGKSDDIVLLRDGQLVSALETRFDERALDLSRDGRWLAYISNETSRDELYVLDLSGSGAKYPVTSEGATGALWTRGGRELIVDGTKGPVAISFTPGTPPVFGAPERIFGQMTTDDRSRLQNLAATADGRRFVGLFNEPKPPLTEIRIVTNWAQRLAGLWK